MRIIINVPDKFVSRLTEALSHWKERQFWNPEENPIDDLLQRTVKEIKLQKTRNGKAK